MRTAVAVSAVSLVLSGALAAPQSPIGRLEGTVKGTLQKPIAGYVPKPGVTYASSKIPTAATSPDSRAGGDAP